MSAGASVVRFGMKLGGSLRTKAIASAVIAAKPRALVSSRFYCSLPARCASLVIRDARPPNPYVAGTPCATIAPPVEDSSSVEWWARTASTRSTPGRSMSPGSLIRRSHFSCATNQIGFLCARASQYSTRCQGSDALERACGSLRASPRSQGMVLVIAFVILCFCGYTLRDWRWSDRPRRATHFSASVCS